MRSLIPPEVLGALSLAALHEKLAQGHPSARWAVRRALEPKHAAKAQKLRHRAEVLRARRASN